MSRSRLVLAFVALALIAIVAVAWWLGGFGRDRVVASSGRWNGSERDVAVSPAAAAAADLHADRADVEREAREPSRRDPSVDAFRFTGRVVAFDSNEGLPFVNVAARTIDGWPIVTTTTGEHGDYELVIEGGVPARVDLVAALDDWSLAVRRGEGTTGSERERTVDFVLRRGFAITGTVRAARDGAPVVDAEVHAVSEGAGFADALDFAVSDEDGRFRIENVCDLPREGIRLVAAAEEHATTIVPDLAVASDRDELEVDVSMAHAVRLSGRVLDASSGVPIAGAAVETLWRNGTSAADGDEAATDASGGFDVGLGAVPPAEAVLLVRAPGRRTRAIGPRADPAGPWRSPLEVRLEPRLLVRGVVRERGSGTPLGRADVRLRPRGFSEAAAGALEDVTVTGDDGRFELEVAAAPIDDGLLLSVSREGHAPAQLDVDAKLAASGAPLDVELERSFAWQARVLRAADRQPVHGAWLTLLPAAGSERFLARARSGLDGRVHLDLAPSAADGARLAVEFLGRRFAFPPLELDPAAAPDERELLLDVPGAARPR